MIHTHFSVTFSSSCPLFNSSQNTNFYEVFMGLNVINYNVLFLSPLLTIPCIPTLFFFVKILQRQPYRYSHSFEKFQMSPFHFIQNKIFNCCFFYEIYNFIMSLNNISLSTKFSLYYIHCCVYFHVWYRRYEYFNAYNTLL